MPRINHNRTDERIKWGLLIVSLLTIVLLAMAALQENVFSNWRDIRSQYKTILEAKAETDQARIVAAQFEIGIDQIVVPDLGAIDRCITCHTGLEDPRMADEPQPFTTHPAGILDYHPLDQFGCTVCHAGQGRATDTEDAHGYVAHWEHPMLAREHRYASCAKCHDDLSLYGPEGVFDLVRRDAPDSGAAFMARGRALVQEKGCLGCHLLEGRGGVLGPDITFVGDKTRLQFDFSHFDREEPREVAYWLTKHFLEPSEISPGTMMPDMGLTEEDASALTAYALSLKKRQTLAAYRAPVLIEPTSLKPPSGAELYAEMCSACHGVDGRSSEVAGIRSPALNNPDSLAVASDDYYRFIIAHGRTGTAMPAWGPGEANLSYDEIDRIVAFIRGWEKPGPSISNASSRAGDAAMGHAYFQGLCANCHGINGEGGIGSSLNSATFLSIASDQFLARTIVHGRPGTAMASWKHLPSQGVNDILAYLRTWQADPPPFEKIARELEGSSSSELASAGEHLFQGYCAVCHGERGEGGVGLRLNSPNVVPILDDKYLYRSIVRGRPTTAMPAWRHLSVEKIAALIAYMRSWPGGNIQVVQDAPTRGDYALGEVHYAVACADCHGANGEGGVGPQITNAEFLSAVSDDVLYRWIAHGRINTAMRGFLEVEEGPISLSREQIGDVIAYLRYQGGRPNRPILRTGIGNPYLGGELFAGNCAGCHGADGEGASGPQLNNATFLASASDGFLSATIALGRERTAMRSMVHGLEGVGQVSPDQVQDIIAFIRQWDRPQAWTRPRAIAEMSARAIASGEGKFRQYCSGCHGPTGRGEQDGDGYFAPALNNPEFLSAASDGFLLATIARGRSNTPMRPFGIGAGGIADLDSGAISDIVSYIRTWEDQPVLGGD